MVTTTKALLKLTAADLMNTDLLMIPREMSLQGAARLLSLHQVSGAPIVDENGVCIGVLSATDFMHCVQGGKKATPACACYEEGICEPWQIVESEELPGESVANFMTTNPVTVNPRTNIQEIARLMSGSRIHRVMVVDEKGRPQGIVTSTDMLAALAYADPNTNVHPQKGDSSWLLRQPLE